MQFDPRGTTRHSERAADALAEARVDGTKGQMTKTNRALHAKKAGPQQSISMENIKVKGRVVFVKDVPRFQIVGTKRFYGLNTLDGVRVAPQDWCFIDDIKRDLGWIIEGYDNGERPFPELRESV